MKKMNVCIGIAWCTISIYGMETQDNIGETTARKSPVGRIQQMQKMVNDDTHYDGRRKSPTFQRPPKILNTFVSQKKERTSQTHNNM